MVQPLSPAEAQAAQRNAVPDVVIEVVNGLLTKQGASSLIIIKQEDVIAALVATGLSRDEIFDRRMLDFEGRFEAAGWQISYDRPGYNESYDAYWNFTAR